MVRIAKFIDIPRIVEIMKWAHQKSVYKDSATFDEDEAKRLVFQSIQRHGHNNIGGTLVLVSENKGRVEGFIIGLLDNVYPCLKELVATDLLFIFTDNADGRDAAVILKQVMRWAGENPKVIEVRFGVTAAMGNYERTAKLYRRIGLEQYGIIFRKETRRLT